jgi:hypothetical protein
MPKTEPWTPHPPVWEWEGLSDATKERGREYYEERAAVIEFDAGEARGPAEMRAYCELVDAMHDNGAFSTEHIANNDVIRQIHVAEIFRRHDAIGRRIMAGTWSKRAEDSRPTLQPEDML